MRRVVMVVVMGLMAGLPVVSSRARAEAFARHVVVSQEANASDIGREVLRRGGNAVDAAVATAFALAVTHPAAGNLGGGGFIVAYLADRREVITIDFREAAPRRADARMYLGPDGKLLPHHRAGARAAGVPGTVRGLGLAHERHGKAAWADLVRPAARLARMGSGSRRRSRPRSTRSSRIVAGPATRSRVATTWAPARTGSPTSPSRSPRSASPTASPWHAGDLLVQRDLADTLDRIAEHGPDEFYTGETARIVARYMAEQGGLITLDDLAAYRAKERPPVHTSYRGFEVYGMGPPSSGGIVVCQMLNILERFDLKADGPRSPRTLHRVTEAMRRAFLTRATEIADPDFVAVPVDDPDLEGACRRARTHPSTTAPPRAPASPRSPSRTPSPGATPRTCRRSTPRASAVALTYTLEEGYGSKAVVAGAGFLLNNEMGDFNLIPGRTDASGRIGTPANLIAPGKRMLSSMSPTIVLEGGRVRLVTGSPGGRTIPNTTLWVVLNVLEFGLDPTEAVAAPRTHHPWFPDVLTLEGESWPPSTVAALEAMGHSVRMGGIQGDAHTIVVGPPPAPGAPRHGIPDRRRGTSKASGD